MAVHDMLMAAAGGTAGAVNYVDDVFSTYLYTGTGSTQTITNGIDLSTKGGMVWLKSRNQAYNHALIDTVRGRAYSLFSNATSAQATSPAGFDLTAFNTNGFSLGPGYQDSINESGDTEVSWTFRKQAKFFDVVTYTGNGVSGRTVAHNLGSAPGCMIIKQYSSSGESWEVYHRSTGYNSTGFLDTTAAFSSKGRFTQNPTSTNFYVTADAGVNASGQTYVAYLFAHDAGGFGAAGTDNVISCGSFTTDGSGKVTVNLGYEPQWVMIKKTSSADNWITIDNMRGWTSQVYGFTNTVLYPNSSSAENSGTYQYIAPTATGFQNTNSAGSDLGASSTYIYIAIRRPMKPPTTGTEVFKPVYGTSSAPAYNSGFVSDAFLGLYTAGDASYPRIGSRLTGTNWMKSSGTEAEAADGIIKWDYMNGVYSGYLDSGYVGEIFRRAPGFFDVVCYTGTSSSYAVNHNLGVVPELIISKDRGNVTDWDVWAGNVLGSRGGMILNLTNANNPTYFNSGSAATSTQFYTRVQAGGYTAGANYVAYLFATVAGVSKVGSYTGTGSTQQINCGFTGGARFVLIKRTDSTGDWYVWDSARGIVSGNDPYQLINTNNAQVTNTDYIDPYSAGFEISSTAPAAINASGGSFIYLAIA